MDGEKSIMGKVHARVFVISNKINKCGAPWIAEAYNIHTKRWDYLHSDFHAAGYALDPEFIDTDGSTDEVREMPPVCIHECLSFVLTLVVLAAALHCVCCVRAQFALAGVKNVISKQTLLEVL
eukprot:4060730-Pleurochrysis_carterae.AAC.1